MKTNRIASRLAALATNLGVNRADVGSLRALTRAATGPRREALVALSYAVAVCGIDAAAVTDAEIARIARLVTKCS